MTYKLVIGPKSKVEFPDLGITSIARVDTGARQSSIWVDEIDEKDGKLFCTFFDGTKKTFNDYKKIVIKNAIGKEERFVVNLKCKLINKVIETPFTLADRSKLKFPVLLGRRLLKKGFIVDVSLKSN